MNNIEWFWRKVAKSDGCWIWTGYQLPSGYGLIGSRKYGSRLAHRFSRLAHFGEIPRGLLVLHRCDTPSCVRPDHLFLGTVADNMIDMALKGRGRGGGKKLSMEDARSIRASVAGGQKMRPVGEQYGITVNAVWQIVHGVTYKEAA